MNPVIENIKKRRSVRAYEAKAIPKDILAQIIDAGNNAPSGGNSQGWRFVVVEEEKFRKKLMEIAIPRYKKWMEQAPENLKEMRKEVDAKTTDPIFYCAPAIIFVIGSGMSKDLDCPMVCQNIMLAARAFNIGSCWVFFGQLALNDTEIKTALEIKDNERVFGPILLGYPKDGFPDSPPKKPANIKII